MGGFVNGEGRVTRAGYTIVSIYLSNNNKLQSISRFPIFFYFIVFPFFHTGVLSMCRSQQFEGEDVP